MLLLVMSHQLAQRSDRNSGLGHRLTPAAKDLGNKLRVHRICPSRLTHW